MQVIIPIAGLGTRLAPATHFIKKPLLPILDTDGYLKPALMITLQQLDSIPIIDEIILVIDQETKIDFSNFHIDTLITTIVQKEPKGLGHALKLCQPHIQDNFVLILGDMITKSYDNINCFEQSINVFNQTKKNIIAVRSMDLTEVSYNGTVCGIKDKNIIYINHFVEKPTEEYAQQHLLLNDGHIYGVFGHYVLSKNFFNLIDDTPTNNETEIGIHYALENLSVNQQLLGYIVNGQSYDIGLPHLYAKTVYNYSQPGGAIC